MREARAAKGQSRATSLDRLIHERLRLGIISALAANESLTFSDLKNLMDTTDGNLSVHARKCWKTLATSPSPNLLMAACPGLNTS